MRRICAPAASAAVTGGLGIGMEIEAVPREVGKAVDDAVSIFTFSIGEAEGSG